MDTQNPNWQKVNIPNLPSPRIGGSLTLNPKENKVFLFGGMAPSGGYLNEGWSMSGNLWKQLNTSFLPPKRSHMSLLWDEAREKAILFGGVGENEILGDTWAFDGQKWAKQQPSNSPMPRASAAMAYDAARKMAILFGGVTRDGKDRKRNPISKNLNDLWAWDGTNWQELIPGNIPPARSRSQMVYDRARQSIVLFGGAAGASLLGDTWTWDGVSWIEQHPVHSPPARTDFGMVYHEVKQQVILFGGFSNGQMVTDTWIWDGEDWSQLQTTISPPQEVADFPQLIYVPDQHEVILFNTFKKKTVDFSHKSVDFVARSEVWRLIY